MIVKRKNGLPRGASLFVWRKVSVARSEDAWQERLGWLGQRLVMVTLAGSRAMRLEAYQLTREEASALVRDFGGGVRAALPLSARELEPKPRPPLRIRGMLLVVSSEKERALAALREPRIPVLLIPATMAFGTGEHATTAACMRALADVSKEMRGRKWDALDLGTGSGILALAARVMGAGRVEAADFDATAVRVARENAEANGIPGIGFRRMDVLAWRPSRKWPVVMANVYSTVLVKAARQIAGAVAQGGWLILSGILRGQAGEVTAAFERKGCRVERTVCRGKWVTLVLRRSSGDSRCASS